jgi:hypothetical protein
MIFAPLRNFFCCASTADNGALLVPIMPGRNLAKPFAIAGFILAEIYMLFTVLAPYGREKHPLPMPIPEVVTVPIHTPPSTSVKITRVLVSSVFFGPFGAIVGTGVGLLVSGLLGDFRQRPATPKPGGDAMSDR